MIHAISRKSRFLITSPAFDASVGEGGPRQHTEMMCGNGKTGMVWLLDGENILEDICICFQKTHKRDRWTPHDNIGHAEA